MNTMNINKQHKLVVREEKILRHEQNKPGTFKSCCHMSRQRNSGTMISTVVTYDNNDLGFPQDLGHTIDSGITLSITTDNLRVFINKTLSVLSPSNEHSIYQCVPCVSILFLLWSTVTKSINLFVKEKKTYKCVPNPFPILFPNPFSNPFSNPVCQSLPILSIRVTPNIAQSFSEAKTVLFIITEKVRDRERKKNSSLFYINCYLS